MSNDCTLTDPPISVPPSLLVSVIGKLDDLSRAVTLDLKAPGDLLYILGDTHEELGGSEFFRYFGEKTRGRAFIGNSVPKVNGRQARALYRSLHQAIRHGQLRSCHTPALGGLGAALLRKAFAGELGLEVDLAKAPGDVSSDVGLLYSESNCRFLVSVAPNKRGDFEQSMKGQSCSCIGIVLEQQRLRIRGRSGAVIVDRPLPALKRAWKETSNGL
jgi:phosphoribosylformylglycinamidine synthase